MRTKIFTLIELLVVVGIIAILLTILLPALRSARDKTQELACANNLKQLGIGLELYCGDYNGYLPLAWDNEFTWMSHIGYCANATPDTFDCPSNKDDTFDRFRNYVDRDAPENYMLNAYSTSDDDGKRFKKAQIRKPSQKIFLLDGRYYQGAWTSYLDRWFPEHNGRSNILFIDGHVESMKSTDIPRSGAAKNTYWMALYD